MDLKHFIPILEWLPKYNKEQLRGDISAGLTVGVMLIPQGMAYAGIAGLPPIYGFYASIVPLIVYAIFGTSRQLAVGPVAMVSLLVSAGVGTLAEGGTEIYIALTIAMALLIGIIQLSLGFFRLGFLVNFLSHPVVSGFTSAAALIIGFSQLKHLLGIKIPQSEHIHEIIYHALLSIKSVNLAALGLGILGIFIILASRKINKAIPGQLIAVVVGIVLVGGLNLANKFNVSIVGQIPSGLPTFVFPQFSWEQMRDLLPIAVTISLVGFMESIAVAKAIQAKHKDYKVVANQELIGLGLANLVGAFFQAYPTTGGFSRTAVNDQAGAKTGIASIISALLIAITLLFLTGLFENLPNAVLASVIMVAVFGLIDTKEAIRLWKTDKTDFWMLLATFLATLSLDIERGILTGVVLSLIVMIYKTTRPHVAILGKIPDKPHYRNVDRFRDLEVRPELLIVRFDAQLYFANVAFFKDWIEDLIEKRKNELKAVILDADSITSIDSSGMHGLEEVVKLVHSLGCLFYFVDAKGPVRDALKKSHARELIGEEFQFVGVQQAVEHFDLKEKGGNEESHHHVPAKYALQTK